MTHPDATGTAPSTELTSAPARPSRRAVALAITLTALGASGCSWFRGGDEASSPIAPQTTKTDGIGRATGDDDRHEGLVDRRPPTTPDAQWASRPVSERPPMVLAPDAGPATQSAIAQPPTLPEYLVLGSVVANVNGTPIYAHELLNQVAPALKAQARDQNPTQFRQTALRELTRQRQTLILDELEYAAAQRNTTADEQRDAKARTFMYREHLISEAGGSEQIARNRAAEQGDDFDKLLAKEERRQLVRLYYVKKVFPRVTVTVDEMRRYYDQNRDRRFTVPSQATIRLIRIEPKEVGSDAAALARAQEAQRRAAAGENFDALSDEYNKMPLLRDNHGKLGPISKGAYRITEVDQAIWQTPQGKVTDVIKGGDGAYYVALIEQRTDGRVMGFDEQEVQDAINGTLRDQRMSELQQQRRAQLMANATVQADDAMLQPVVEMAMQLYPSWHAGNGG